MSQEAVGARGSRLSRQQTRARNRLALIASARRLIVANGVGVPLEAITDDAGLTTGAIYSIFGSRNKLLLAVTVEQLGEVIATTTRLAGIDGSLEDVLGAYAQQIESWRGADGAREQSAFALHVVLLASEDEEFRNAVEKEKARELDSLQSALTGRTSRHLPSGEVTSADDARQLTLALRMLVDGDALRWAVASNDGDYRSLIEGLGALVPTFRPRASP